MYVPCTKCPARCSSRNQPQSLQALGRPVARQREPEQGSTGAGKDQAFQPAAVAENQADGGQCEHGRGDGDTEDDADEQASRHGRAHVPPPRLAANGESDFLSIVARGNAA
jgi:hypothetical protein